MSPSSFRLTTTTSPSPSSRRQSGSCVEEEELHPGEDLAQAGHDPHPPARMEVRAELVDQLRPLRDVDARPTARAARHQVGRERDDRLVAVAQILERDAQAERLHVDPPGPSIAHEPVVGLEPEQPFQRSRDRLERSIVEPEQPVRRVADRAERVEEVSDARERRRGRRPLSWSGKQPGRAVREQDQLRLLGARNSLDVREKRSSIGSWLPARWTRTSPLRVPLRTYDARRDRAPWFFCADERQARRPGAPSSSTTVLPRSISHGAEAVVDARLAGRMSSPPSTLKFWTSIRSTRRVRRK